MLETYKSKKKKYTNLVYYDLQSHGLRVKYVRRPEMGPRTGPGSDATTPNGEAHAPTQANHPYP